ncbi:Nif-specific regulatory protein [Klebsiella michiganensis]|nr:Nif-specific regulatory protein [Klebsiella michiganensis]
MIYKSDSDTTVRRFDLSQQFTAMQRISVVLSRATEASKTLQEVLSVLHNDAFMQHGCNGSIVMSACGSIQMSALW